MSGQQKHDHDERVSIPLDPEEALRALLAVRPDDEPGDQPGDNHSKSGGSTEGD